MSEKDTAALFARHEAIVESLDADLGGNDGIVVACMDERNALTEEALGLSPARVIRFASGGGRIGAGDFIALFGEKLASLPSESRRVFLVTHEVVGRTELGCAAFKNDIAEQERHFLALRRELAARLPTTPAHALCLDTSTGAVRPLETDGRDAGAIAARLAAGIGPQFDRPSEEGHAGRRIYVGDAYRAWIAERNDSFHISPDAPSLRGDLDIALSVMLHHSAVRPDRENPLILHLDYPRKAREIDSRRSLEDMNRAAEAFLSGPDARRLAADGRLRVLRSETDIRTWSSQLL